MPAFQPATAIVLKIAYPSPLYHRSAACRPVGQEIFCTRFHTGFRRGRDDVPRSSGGSGTRSAARRTSIRAAPSFTLFEGLPHESFEADALQRELARQRTVRAHGFHFYEETWAVERAPPVHVTRRHKYEPLRIPSPSGGP